jgi:hypothetical protein
MKYSLKALNAAHHMTELMNFLVRMSTEELESLVAAANESDLPPKTLEGFRRLLTGDDLNRTARRRADSQFDEFRFERVMEQLRNTVMHSLGDANASEIDWLLKIILSSPAVFDSVREVDNFLSNMTGVEHTTKSTGRDRVVDWYFKHIDALPAGERNGVYLKIARHIFAKGRSNYREWKEVLYGGNGR